MKAVIAAFVASIGCACTSVATRDDSSNDREVAFSCANGESLSVRFLPAQSVAVLVRNGKTSIRELDEPYWGEPMTCRHVADHARLINEAQLGR